MATPIQIAWLKSMYESAKAAGHPWAAAAACEAAVETGWGDHIPHGSNNVLGIKWYAGWNGPICCANGTEQNKDGTWTGSELDTWCVFNSPEDCFVEQIRILQEPRYEKAMAAATAEEYIVEECKIWSTGLLKGQAVLAIYRAHKDDLT